MLYDVVAYEQRSVGKVVTETFVVKRNAGVAEGRCRSLTDGARSDRYTRSLSPKSTSTCSSMRQSFQSCQSHSAVVLHQHQCVLTFSTLMASL